MSTPVDGFLVRIWSADRTTVVGAGILSTATHVLTCAHVIRQALTLPGDDEARVPDGEVPLDLPRIAPGALMRARVAGWWPAPAGAVTAEAGKDIALLELLDPPPPESRQAPMRVMADFWGHTFRALGFPRGYDSGAWASGVLRAEIAGGWVQIEDVKTTGYPVAPGFSGAPVWSDIVGGVVGMVVAADRQAAARVACIIPTRMLADTWPHIAHAPATPRRQRVFLSYKRDAEPDEALAGRILAALRPIHDVFIDRDLLVGASWAERIDAELSQSDVVIALLSERSVRSEMVAEEIAKAHHLARSNGVPRILPVRVAYAEPFHYPLSAYLDHIHWATWAGPNDTEPVIDDLLQAVAGREIAARDRPPDDRRQPAAPHPVAPPLPAAQPLTLEDPEGAIASDSVFYVERPPDARLVAVAVQEGKTISITGARQMGKSSLLNRVRAAANKAGKRTVFLDFQLLDDAVLQDDDRFYRRFCAWIASELRLPSRIDEHWDDSLGNKQCCTLYVEHYILAEVPGSLVLLMDEVERMFKAAFRSEFFGMLRSWHNSRARVPIWKRLDLALATSTEPFLLIDDPTQSPFNVGTVAALQEFSAAQVAEVNRRHGAPLDAERTARLVALVGGHPYLVRRALYLIASGQYTADDLFAEALRDGGPFKDHLRGHLFRLSRDRELCRSFDQIIRHGTCADERIVFRLESAGLVRLTEDRGVVPRYPLYAEYFRERLHV